MAPGPGWAKERADASPPGGGFPSKEARILDLTTQTQLASALVLGPALAGAVIVAAPRMGKPAAVLATAASLVSFVIALSLLAAEKWGVGLAWDWAPEAWVQVAWRLEFAPLALAALVSGIGALVLQYAGAYFGPSEKGNRAVGTLALFEAAMLGLVLSDNLFALFVFWELTGLCSFFLIATDADKRDDAFPAAQQALLVTAGGGLPMLVAFIYLAITRDTASLSALSAMDLPITAQTIVLALILPAVVTKSAQVPFHFWLPGAMAAPTPISAYLHSATMVKAGVILLLFFYPLCGASPLWSQSLIPFGVATCLWGSYRALCEDDIKLLMAWSTVSQLGLLVITLGLGSDLAVRAAALHLFAHAIFKAGLFLSIGGVDHAAHTRLLEKLGGMGKKVPILFGAAGILGASMMGLPPVAGFLSKELIVEEALHSGLALQWVALLGIVVGSVGTVGYTARFVLGTFTGEPRSKSASHAHSPGFGFLVGPCVLGALTLLGGLMPGLVDHALLTPFMHSLLGEGEAHAHLALWHGVTPALLTSLGIVASGFAVHFVLKLRLLRSDFGVMSGPHVFDAFIEWSQKLGKVMNGAFANADPRIYFALAMLMGLAGALPLVGNLSSMTRAEGLWIPGLLVLGIQIVALVIIIRVKARLSRILLVSLVGFTVAIFYRMLAAPDLMLTQVTVEVLSTVFMVLAIRFLPDKELTGGWGAGGQALRIGVSGLIGLLAAALAWTAFENPAGIRLTEYFFEATPAIGKGSNMVNVILVDFRGLDTYIETTVVLLAALGVGGLMVGLETRRGKNLPAAGPAGEEAR